MEGSLVTKLQQQTEGLKPLYVHAVGFSMGSFLPVGQYFIFQVRCGEIPCIVWNSTQSFMIVCVLTSRCG